MVMKRFILLISVLCAVPSCVGTTVEKPVGPVSETSRIPWNQPVAGQGGGQFSMLPQNQYRR